MGPSLKRLSWLHHGHAGHTLVCHSIPNGTGKVASHIAERKECTHVFWPVLVCDLWVRLPFLAPM